MLARLQGRDVGCDGQVLGVANDHKTETVVFEFEEDLTGAEVYLRINGATGNYKARLQLPMDGNRASWLVEDTHTTKGKLTCQLELVHTGFADPHRWQSKQFTLEVEVQLTV